MKLNSGLSSEEARERILDAGIAISENISRKELAKTLDIRNGESRSDKTKLDA